MNTTEIHALFDDVVLTIDDVSCYTRLHRTTISRLIKSGELSAYQIGQRFFVKKSRLEEFIERKIVEGIRKSQEMQ